MRCTMTEQRYRRGPDEPSFVDPKLESLAQKLILAADRSDPEARVAMRKIIWQIWQGGAEEGRAESQTEFYNDGYDRGWENHRADWGDHKEDLSDRAEYARGNKDGFTQGHRDGLDTGKRAGYSKGYTEGREAGKKEGRKEYYTRVYGIGLEAGKIDAQEIHNASPPSVPDHTHNASPLFLPNTGGVNR